jgi:hypothetical protein
LRSRLQIGCEKQRRRAITVYARRALYLFLLAGVAGGSMALGYHADATRGLLGCALGALIGLLLCLVSHILWSRARTAAGHAIVTAVMAAVVASFALLIVAVFAVYFLWPEVVQPVALTALAVYLVHRFAEAFQASRGAAAIPLKDPVEGLPGEER